MYGVPMITGETSGLHFLPRLMPQVAWIRQISGDQPGVAFDSPCECRWTDEANSKVSLVFVRDAERLARRGHVVLVAQH